MFCPHFDLIAFKVLVEEPNLHKGVCLATMEIGVKGEVEITAAKGMALLTLWIMLPGRLWSGFTLG